MNTPLFVHLFRMRGVKKTTRRAVAAYINPHKFMSLYFDIKRGSLRFRNYRAREYDMSAGLANLEMLLLQKKCLTERDGH
jgi:hypothetical protein